MKFPGDNSDREAVALDVTLMVIGALVLQNLVLVAALARLAWPNALSVVRALVKVGVVVLTGPIGEPFLVLAGLAALGLLAWLIRRPIARGVEVVR